MLTAEQIAEMNQLIREESQNGRPEIAARIRSALDRGEVYEAPGVEVVEPVEQPPLGGPGSGKVAWVEYALSVSDIDEEVLESITKDDIIAMLRANGIIPMPEPNEE